MTHPASAGLRELADKLDALAAKGCVLDIALLYIKPTKSQFQAAMQHFGITPVIRKSGGTMDRWAEAGGEALLDGLRVDIRNYVPEVCDSVTESAYTTVWKLPEVQS